MVKNNDRDAFANGTHGGGLTKREYMASQILAGLLLREGWGEETVSDAIQIADELLRRLGDP